MENKITHSLSIQIESQVWLNEKFSLNKIKRKSERDTYRNVDFHVCSLMTESSKACFFSFSFMVSVVSILLKSKWKKTDLSKEQREKWQCNLTKKPTIILIIKK